MTKSKAINKIVAIMMAVIVASTMFLTTASAATCSSGTKSRTITVETKANWWIPGSESITLSQTKGIRTEKQYTLLGKYKGTKTKKCYGTWKVVAKSTDGKHTVSKKLNGGSLKLNLKANKTYKVTVTWDSQIDLIDSLEHGSFTTLPTWKVKSVYKVSDYY